MKIKKSIILLFTAFFIFSLFSGTTMAEDVIESDDTDSGMIVLDLVVARPLGLVAIGVGTAAFVVSLPFTMLTGTVEPVGEKLVVAPLKFTFTRPLGRTE
jgi:hypothetical protein